MPIIIVTISQEAAERLAAAYNAKLAPPVPITDIPTLKAALIDDMKQNVRDYERRIAFSAVVLPPDIDPT